MARVHNLRHVFKLAGAAYCSGGVRVSKFLTTWDISGACESPRMVEYYGREGVSLYSKKAKSVGKAHMVELTVRCRRCPACLKLRQIEWGERAVREYKMAPRTWFMTFTFSQEEHWKYKLAAIKRLENRSVRFKSLSEYEQWAEIAREHASELTLFWKRMRKGLSDVAADGELEYPPASFRYMLVTEAHKSGEPHFHGLCHEIAGCSPIRKKTMEKHWRNGFTNFKLVNDERLAYYVAKYLGKDRRARVRASRNYGNGYTGLLP